MNKKYIGWIIITIVIVVVLYIIHWLNPNDKELDFSIAVIGTGFSILGIAVTFDQISLTRSKTESTSKAVEETRKRINTIASMYTITDTIRLADEAEIFLRQKSVDESLMRLKDFDRMLININNEELRSQHEETSREISRLMQLIKFDVRSLNKTDLQPQSVEWNTVLTHVEDTKNTLTEYLNTINRTI